jgi:RimJ/RimL family protein N-acetyltransferase
MPDRIRTDRLLLRPLGEADAERLAIVLNDPAVLRQVLTWPSPITALHVAGRIAMANARAAVCGDVLQFGVETAGEGLIGMIGGAVAASGTASFGYMLGRAYWGRGYGTEAVAGWMAAALARGAQRFEAEVFEDNPRSARVLTKLGFAEDGPGQGGFCLGRMAPASARVYRRGLTESAQAAEAGGPAPLTSA